MNFDAIRFFIDYNIVYYTEGKNVSPGWVNCRCPFCNDKSNHLGINTSNAYVYCWKCGFHTLYDTIKVLTNEPHPKSIASKYGVLLNSYSTNKTFQIKNNKIIVPGGGLNKYHKKYLEKRNFDWVYLVNKYKIKGTDHTDTNGYEYRIMFPIYYNNNIVSYQGRDYTNQQELRYKACSKKNENIHHKHILFNLDNCNGKKVIVCEGVFDVLRVGDNSCATFGTGFTDSQINILGNKFDEVYILYDGDDEAIKKANQAITKLNLMGTKTYLITLDGGDPAEMTEDEIISLKRDIGVY